MEYEIEIRHIIAQMHRLSKTNYSQQEEIDELKKLVKDARQASNHCELDAQSTRRALSNLKGRVSVNDDNISDAEADIIDLERDVETLQESVNTLESESYKTIKIKEWPCKEFVDTRIDKLENQLIIDRNFHINSMHKMTETMDGLRRYIDKLEMAVDTEKVRIRAWPGWERTEARITTLEKLVEVTEATVEAHRRALDVDGFSRRHILAQHMKEVFRERGLDYEE